MLTPPLRTRLIRILREEVAVGSVELFAYAIMPNHLHLVLRQGDEPLHRFMQPVLRRVALLVQKRWRRGGHVFERRYRDRVCGDPDYLRNAIVYTHLNPTRAGLCEDPSEYPWSSWGAWCTGGTLAADGAPYPVSIEATALIFASGRDTTLPRLREAYRRFEGWRRETDGALELRGNGATVGAWSVPTLPPSPPVSAGNRHWRELLAPRRPSSDGGPEFEPFEVRSGRVDLALIARRVIQESGSSLVEAIVRSRWGGMPYSQARRSIAIRATAAGYTGREIANYLRISPGTVSRVVNHDRKQLVAQHNQTG